MKTNATILALSALLCGATHAADVPEADFPFITIGTNTFTKAHLRAYSATEGSLRHDGGVEKIRLSDLPEPARSKFYDPQKEQSEALAKEAAEAQSQARAAAIQPSQPLARNREVQSSVCADHRYGGAHVLQKPLSRSAGEGSPAASRSR